MISELSPDWRIVLSVMYGGYIIEEAPVKALYVEPKHPYTIGLLGSLAQSFKISKGTAGFDRWYSPRPVSKSNRRVPLHLDVLIGWITA